MIKILDLRIVKLKIYIDSLQRDITVRVIDSMGQQRLKISYQVRCAVTLGRRAVNVSSSCSVSSGITKTCGPVNPERSINVEHFLLPQARLRSSKSRDRSLDSPRVASATLRDLPSRGSGWDLASFESVEARRSCVVSDPWGSGFADKDWTFVGVESFRGCSRRRFLR